MPDKEVVILGEEQIAEIEAVNKAYRIDWRYPNHQEHIRALCKTVRALRNEVERIQGERDGLDAATTVLANDNTALREQLAQALTESDHRHDLLSSERRENDRLRQRLDEEIKRADGNFTSYERAKASYSDTVNNWPK